MGIYESIRLGVATVRRSVHIRTNDRRRLPVFIRLFPHLWLDLGRVALEACIEAAGATTPSVADGFRPTVTLRITAAMVAVIVRASAIEEDTSVAASTAV